MKINSLILAKSLSLKNCYPFESNGISIDSRTIEPGNIFFAIKGTNFDGNEYAAEALAKGASVAVISDLKYKLSDKMILVADTTEALKKLGAYVKNYVGPKKVIGITGSVGKTTTRAWISEILSHKCNVFSSIKNYNTIYGLPISLTLLEEGTEVGVFELGTNNPGEISELSQYLQPDIAMITNIYESHIGRFKSKECLAKEKLSIIDGLENGSTLIYDGDSDFRDDIEKAASERGLKFISVGFNNSCDFCVDSIEKRLVTLNTPDGVLSYKVGCDGRHFAYISACAAATIFALGEGLAEMLEYFEGLSPLKGRGELAEYIYNCKKFSIIDDSYNASPSAMVAALEGLSKNENSRKIAIIGQMGELGQHELHYHNIIAKKIQSLEIDEVFFIGNKNLHEVFRSTLKQNITCFEKLTDFAIEKILGIIENKDIVLLKGSRNIELNRFVDYIK